MATQPDHLTFPDDLAELRAWIDERMPREIPYLHNCNPPGMPERLIPATRKTGDVQLWVHRWVVDQLLAELPEPERSRHHRAMPDAPTGPASTVAIERLIAAVERRYRRAPTTRDVRLRAAELIRERGWTPDARDVRPLNTFRALQEAAAELGAPAMRRPALAQLREDLGVKSIFDWEFGLWSKRDGFEPEFVRERSQAEVVAALRAQPWRPPGGMR